MGSNSNYAPINYEALADTAAPDYAAKQQQLAQQMQRAQALRNAPTPEGRTIGRMFVAANPLEMVAGGLGHLAGGYQAHQIQGQQQATQGQEEAQRRDLMKQLGPAYWGQTANGAPVQMASQTQAQQPAATGDRGQFGANAYGRAWGAQPEASASRFQLPPMVSDDTPFSLGTAAPAQRQAKPDAEAQRLAALRAAVARASPGLGAIDQTLNADDIYQE